MVKPRPDDHRTNLDRWHFKQKHDEDHAGTVAGLHGRKPFRPDGIAAWRNGHPAVLIQLSPMQG